MPKVIFTPNIQRHVACPSMSVEGATVRTVLDAVFETNPQARSYILDDQGALRKHMAIYVDGVLISDRSGLSDPVPEGGTVGVFQALSGG
jgi:sulfur-carrier protein